jgi:hypothetical protein
MTTRRKSARLSLKDQNETLKIVSAPKSKSKVKAKTTATIKVGTKSKLTLWEKCQQSDIESSRCVNNLLSTRKGSKDIIKKIFDRYKTKDELMNYINNTTFEVKNWSTCTSSNANASVCIQSLFQQFPSIIPVLSETNKLFYPKELQSKGHIVGVVQDPKTEYIEAVIKSDGSSIILSSPLKASKELFISSATFENREIQNSVVELIHSGREYNDNPDALSQENENSKTALKELITFGMKIASPQETIAIQDDLKKFENDNRHNLLKQIQTGYHHLRKVNKSPKPLTLLNQVKSGKILKKIERTSPDFKTYYESIKSPPKSETLQSNNIPKPPPPFLSKTKKSSSSSSSSFVDLLKAKSQKDLKRTKEDKDCQNGYFPYIRDGDVNCISEKFDFKQCPEIGIFRRREDGAMICIPYYDEDLRDVVRSFNSSEDWQSKLNNTVFGKVVDRGYDEDEDYDPSEWGDDTDVGTQEALYDEIRKSREKREEINTEKARQIAKEKYEADLEKLKKLRKEKEEEEKQHRKRMKKEHKANLERMREEEERKKNDPKEQERRRKEANLIKERQQSFSDLRVGLNKKFRTQEEDED